jgi:hypothetical protein
MPGPNQDQHRPAQPNPWLSSTLMVASQGILHDAELPSALFIGERDAKRPDPRAGHRFQSSCCGNVELQRFVASTGIEKSFALGIATIWHRHIETPAHFQLEFGHAFGNTGLVAVPVVAGYDRCRDVFKLAVETMLQNRSVGIT